jgi:hypothetical protein
MLTFGTGQNPAQELDGWKKGRGVFGEVVPHELAQPSNILERRAHVFHICMVSGRFRKAAERMAELLSW